MIDDRWRALHAERFADLPFDCGNETNPGIIYGPDLRDWSAKATTPDQYRIERFIDRFDLRDKRLLHIGIGNSGLARRFHRRVKAIVGTTIDQPEIDVASTLGHPNYSAVVHNKYSGDDGAVPGRFDVIVDNNLTSPCCCVRHLAQLFQFFGDHLEKGGMVVTDRVGLGWIPPESNPRWRFDFADLAAVSEMVGLTAFRATNSVYVLSRSELPVASFGSLSRHAGRRARAFPLKVVRNGPRKLVQAFRKGLKQLLSSTVLRRMGKRHPGNDTNNRANLFIVGAPKCGTTAWVEYLRSHPDIFFPPTKEECYFALDLPRFRFIHSEPEYSRLFDDGQGTEIIGEASAMYLFSEAAAAAIRDYNPAAKILIFLRDQEDFLPSLHNQFLGEFSEEIEDFETAWRLSGRRPRETIPATCLEPRTLDYAAMGRFHEQVERYLASFPREQVCVLHFRDWVANPRAAYLKIMAFLRLEDDGRTSFPPINPGVTYRSRKLARWVMRPPQSARRFAQLVKRLTGPAGRLAVEKIRSAGLRTSPGYPTELKPELRDEIRRYYAEDNRRLERALSRPLPTDPSEMSNGAADQRIDFHREFH